LFCLSKQVAIKSFEFSGSRPNPIKYSKNLDKSPPKLDSIVLKPLLEKLISFWPKQFLSTLFNPAAV
jgi:hypothetical protein